MMHSMRMQPVQKSKQPKLAQCECALRSGLSVPSAAKHLHRLSAADRRSFPTAEIAPLFSATCLQYAASARRQARPVERGPGVANPTVSELDQPEAEPLPAAMGQQVEQPLGTGPIDISEDPDEPPPHSRAQAHGVLPAQVDSETESMPLPGSPLPEDEPPSSEPPQQHQQRDLQPAEQPVEHGVRESHEQSADPGTSDMQIDLEAEPAGLSHGLRLGESRPSHGDAAAASEERTLPSKQAAAAGAPTAMPAEGDSFAAAAEQPAVADRIAAWHAPAAWEDAAVGRQPPPAVEPRAGKLVPPPQPAASQNERNHEHPAHPAGADGQLGGLRNADWDPIPEAGAEGEAPLQDAAMPAADWPAEQPPAVSGANKRFIYRTPAAFQARLPLRKKKKPARKSLPLAQRVNDGKQETPPNGSKALGDNSRSPPESARASGWEQLRNWMPQTRWGISTRARRGHSPQRSGWSQRQEAARGARPPADVAREAPEAQAAHQPEGTAQPDAAGKANDQRGGRGSRGRGRAGRPSRRHAGLPLCHPSRL